MNVAGCGSLRLLSAMKLACIYCEKCARRNDFDYVEGRNSQRLRAKKSDRMTSTLVLKINQRAVNTRTAKQAIYSVFQDIHN